MTNYNMKNFCLLALVALFTSHVGLAQIGHGGQPLNWGKQPQLALEWKSFGALDIATLQSEDEFTATMKDAPWRFGVEHSVNWTMSNSGNWSEENGFRVWRLAVRAQGATSLSFYLSRFVVPEGGELFVYNGDRTSFLGSFNHLNVKDWEGLALSLLEGDKAVLEYREPLSMPPTGEIAVGQVVHGYRSLLKRQQELQAANASVGPFGNSGACNINVNCPEGDDWQVENQSVALIVNGGFAACSGAMINNTANDGTPYFLTANHCLGTPNTWTYYFNHESATCSGSTGPTDNSISGGTLLVADGGSDVALIELSSTPPASWGVEYAGWDATGATPTSAVGIHHPSGDVKKICFEDNSPYYDVTGGAQVWWIDQWELGVTEPGSSGSPLFDQNHRIIGQLYGGAAACSGTVNNGTYDFYGRFDVSWGLGVSQYLDPTNSGVQVLDGYPTGFNSDEGCTDPTACNYSPEAIIDNGTCTTNDLCGECGGDNSSCGGCTDPTACNYDAAAIVDDGSCYQADPTFGCDCNSEGSVVATLAQLATSEPYTFEGTSNPEASSIDIVLNFTGSGSSWPADMAVTITDPNGQCIAFGGYDSSPAGCTSIGGYQAVWPASWAAAGNGTFTATVDLTSAGLAGTGQWSLALYNGWQGAPDASYDVAFTLDGVCTVTDEVAGCTQEFSCNYNPDATVDDGSCIQPYDIVYVDEDGDGYGDQAIADWCPPLESWLSLVPGDCDDSNATMYPNAFGTAEGLDNNCNGTIDPSEELPGTCPEDVNQDGTVSVADVLAILAEFGCTAECSVDVNDDGNVNVSDILALLAAFGNDC